MPSDSSTAIPASGELALRRSVGLTAGFLVLALTALASVLLAGLPPSLRWPLAVLILVLILREGARLIRPALALRLVDGRLEYRLDQRAAWLTLPAGARCFVSPFYIGWSAHGRRSCGVFRSQLDPEDFRRLAVTLRQRER